MNVPRLLGSLAVSVVAILVAGGLGVLLPNAVASPVSLVVAVLAVGVVAAVVQYGRRRARTTGSRYW